MSISSEKRRAGPFLGDGLQVEFPFSFKIFEPEHIEVRESKEGAATDYVVTEGYSVTLNDNQDINPGGLVVLHEPLPAGMVLSLLSNAPALQEMVLTNRGGFFPETLNDNADHLVILIQQLKEKVDRALVVASTASITADDLLFSLMDVASTANEYAQKAEQIYNDTVATKALVEQIRLHVDQQKAKVDLAEAEVEEDRIEVQQMLADAQEVNKVTVQFLPHVNELIEVGDSIEDVRAVASDLQGLPVESMDLGLITDAATPIYDTKESNIAVLSENIALLKTVVENIEKIQTAAQAAQRAEAAAVAAEASAAEAEVTVERVAEIEKTDFEEIYNKGVS